MTVFLEWEPNQKKRDKFRYDISAFNNIQGVTNFASVPRGLKIFLIVLIILFATWWIKLLGLLILLIEIMPKFVYASIYHDWLYMNQKLHKLDRKYADKFFLKELKEIDKIDIIRRNIMYAYVRIFGWYNWNKFKK